MTNHEEIKACREPTWEELDDKGKIVRLQRVVRNQGLVLEKVVDYINQLAVHKHAEGEIVTPLAEPRADKGIYYRNLRGELL